MEAGCHRHKIPPCPLMQPSAKNDQCSLSRLNAHSEPPCRNATRPFLAGPLSELARVTQRSEQLAIATRHDQALAGDPA